MARRAKSILACLPVPPYTPPAMPETRILVVDDDEDVASSLAELLALSGYATATANSGAGALEQMAGFDPHCVLLDVQMPDIDGLALARQLRSTYGDDVILIAVTGRAETEADVTETFRIVDHYLVKPVDPAALEKVLPPL